MQQTMKIEQIPIKDVKPYEQNAKAHPKEQVEKIARPNGKVLDLFGGSGSTLIACEKTGRTCFMMELDEHYCDVIIARWEKFTGLKAELVP